MNLKLAYKDQNLQHRFWMVLILFIGAAFSFQYAVAQVRVPFTQRTSSYTPDTKIYNIKGDFQLIGNTNMSLASYNENSNNSNTSMKYVDVDNDSGTLNSSSATLTFSTEGGADPSCSNIIYAGLYWTGRAHDGTSSNTFSVNYSASIFNGKSLNGYTLSISSASATSLGSNGAIATYTFTPVNGGNSVVFRFSSWSTGSSWSNYKGTMTVQVGSGQETSLSGSTSGSSNYTFTLSTPYTINTGSQTITISSLQKRRDDTSISDNYFVRTSSTTKQLDKHKVKFKKAGGTYQTITANISDIYYPTNSDSYMYSAYAEVTDYVKANKDGEYFVADMALLEGNGGSTGFYGGWGLIVVYENSKMKWRDVTIFDGYAYVDSDDGEQVLSVSGFNTVQQGAVGVKLGLMAGEGDIGISGDQFKIRNAANTDWATLSHGGNTSNNFFNSSIYTGGNARNPELKNNTGLDISMFTLNNSDKSLMKNGQTSTSFQYSSTQDSYIIFCIAMAVDAYIPEVEVENSIGLINDVSFNNGTSSATVYPNDEIEYTLYLKNLGSEAVKDGKIVIPIPFTTSYVSVSDQYLWTGSPGMSGTAMYDPSLGGTGSIVWDIGYIPLPANKNDVLAKLTYKLRVTNDCFILNNSDCITVSVDGYTTGTGVTSGVSFTNSKFVTGFIQDGACNDQPIYTPVNFNIDVTDYLKTQCKVPGGEDPDYYKQRKFKYCGLSAGTTIPYTDVSPNFPKGSQFYSAITYDENGFVIPATDATHYTSESGFSFDTFGKSITYYAIPPGMNVTCYWEFIITIDEYCGNYWHGLESTDWGIPNNWTAKKVPDIGQDIEFATVANNKNNPAQRDLYLDTDRIIGNLINNSDMNMVVSVGKQLTINGTVTDENSPKGTIVVKSSPDSPTGTLIFTDPIANRSVEATVEFINKAYQCDSCGFYRKQWQYFGIPVQSSVFPYLNAKEEIINQWVEPHNGNKWRPAPFTPDTELKAFKGYEMTNTVDTLPTHIHSFAGTLNVGDAEVSVTKTSNVNYSGINLIGNSFTAALPITSSAINLGSVKLKENTVYLFNMGTRDQWRKLNGGTAAETATKIAAGQYQAVPFNLAGQAGIPDRILSMHTFMLNVTTPGTITLQYDQLMKNELNSYTLKPWKSLIEGSNSNQLPHIIMDVIGSGSADRIWLFEHQESTTGFDNGWDGYKMKESDLIQAYIYGSDQSDYQVATVPSMAGTTIGIKNTSNESYTLNFSVTPEVELRKLYLRDLLTGRDYPIVNNAEYTISGSKSALTNRFKIVASSSAVDNDSNEVGLINIYVRNNIIVVENQTEEECMATVYDMTGKSVSNKKIGENVIDEINDVSLNRAGIYIVKVVGKNKAVNKTDKVVLK